MSMSMEVQVKPHVKTKDSKTNCVMISPSAFESLSRYVFFISFFYLTLTHTHTLINIHITHMWVILYNIYICSIYLVSHFHTHMITQNEITLTLALERRSHRQFNHNSYYTYITHTIQYICIRLISLVTHTHTYMLTQKRDYAYVSARKDAHTHNAINIHTTLTYMIHTANNMHIRLVSLVILTHLHTRSLRTRLPLRSAQNTLS